MLGSVKRFYFCKSDVSAHQGHSRSLILVPIESAHATSYSSVIATLVLSCTVSEILHVFVLLTPRSHSYSTLILGMFPLHQIAHIGVDVSRDLKLFGCEIIFEEFQTV